MGEHLRILIADDNYSDRIILKALLAREGHEVITAEDGLQAVDLFMSEQPDIVLLDLMMPNLDGYGAASRIKALSDERLVPIVFLTAMTDVDALTRCLEVGGDDFLTKPYQKDILHAKLRALRRIQQLYKTVSHQRDQIRKHQKRMEREQQQAKAIFDRIAHPGCLDAPFIHHHLSSLHIFNGDVLLAAEKPGGGVHVFLGDFTGHGLPAAIGAMPISELFYDMTGRGFALSDIVSAMNSRLCELLPVGVFCCAFAAEIDIRESVVRVWNGGMPDGLLWRDGQGVVAQFRSTHLPLGITDDDRFRAVVETIGVEEHDRLLIYSDGMTACSNAKDEQFGEERILQCVEAVSKNQIIIDELLTSIGRFCAGTRGSDDATALEVLIVPEQMQGRPAIADKNERHGPKDFSFALTLQAQALRESDPLPVLLDVLMQIPGLRVHRGQVFAILAELYSNALEHGVLQLDSALKRSSEGFAEYYRLRHEKLMALDSGRIEVFCRHCPKLDGGTLEIQIHDSGQGFDYADRLNRPLEHQRGYAGRGVGLLSRLCERVEYSGNGNTVAIQYRWRQVDIHDE